MDDADQGMEASAAAIRDRVRRQDAVTLNHQQAIYTEKLRPSPFHKMMTFTPSLYRGGFCFFARRSFAL